ncbi:hypothetical protein E4N62_44840 [Streptomyces sp. MNU76]|uniref:hypothetical protein n=1 Tax=Streptomyces sp. MNU76 TaxID=2560026 RepID=UPI001E30A5A6|nr:hypothetical protein [Streptomyces sp. MNU76]MCC9707715.1 hypothetical protein [Streptomyces sp. MNU76]MCC9711720.1 hypothetical protein [Streptomyces sp. MNU76]
MMDVDPVTAWRADMAWYLGIAVASGLAFGLGQGLVAGLLAGTSMLVFALALALGRRRIDAIRAVGGAGDERNRALYMRSLSVAGGVLGLVVTGWYLVSVARGEPDGTLLALTVLFAGVFVGAGVVSSWRG